MQAITLDARELDPPEPLRRATEILHRLQPGQYLHMLHRRVPHPLFDNCRALGLCVFSREGEDPACEIFACLPGDAATLRQEQGL